VSADTNLAQVFRLCPLCSEAVHGHVERPAGYATHFWPVGSQGSPHALSSFEVDPTGVMDSAIELAVARATSRWRAAADPETRPPEPGHRRHHSHGPFRERLPRLGGAQLRQAFPALGMACGFRGLRPLIPIERDHAVQSKTATCSAEGGRGVVAGIWSGVRFSWLRQVWHAAQ
jgi:hypothetical protein